MRLNLEKSLDMVEIQGLKPWTSALPALRSNQLSYIPKIVNREIILQDLL